MNKWRKQLGKIKLIKRLSSIKITVSCLLLLFILTLWGTIAQVNQGLYGAQERFFYSWYFLTAGFFPFPGAQLVLWILFVNLACVSITRFVYRLSHLGIIIIHLGLLTYFVAAFITYKVTVESNVTLLEGEGTNLSSDYRRWELSIWPENSTQQRRVTALDAAFFHKTKPVFLKEPGISVLTKEYYPNAQAYLAQAGETARPVNQSGIGSLVKKEIDIEPEKNIPGGIFELKGDRSSSEVLLFGGEQSSNMVMIDGRPFHVQLRHKRYELPFIIRLNDFQMELHPGTETAKSYKSLVTVNHDHLSRDVLIWMNHPLRFKNYTLYQASYSIDRFGRERSTLAVVKNAGRLLPYVASGVTFFGLALHFLMMAFKPKLKNV